MPAVATRKTAKVKETEDPKYYVNVRALTGGLKKVAFASVGVLAVANEKAQHQLKYQSKNARGSFDKLANRGEKAQAKGRKALQQLLNKSSDEAKKTAKNVGGKVEDQLTTVLGKLNVPTKSDVQDLTRRIDSLSRKIDKL